MKKLVLIDSNAIIHRAYHSMPKTFSNKRGERTNAVYGFTTTLIKVLEDLKPDYMAASFDVSKATFRTEQYSEYKANRAAADQELYDQIPKVRALLEVFDVPIYDCEGYEADDCIGTIASKYQEDSDLEIYIVTGDKDLFQLLNGHVFVYNLRKGLSDTGIYDSVRIREEFHLEPHSFIDLKALAGDPSDNIPGVPGIGPKTATDLIQKFGTMEKMYEEIESRVKKQESREDAAKALDIKLRILNLLIEYKDQAYMSHKLATIYKEVPMEFDLEQCKWGEYDKEKLKEFFAEMGFNSLLKRFGVLPSEPVKTKKAEDQKKKDEQLKLL